MYLLNELSAFLLVIGMWMAVLATGPDSGNVFNIPMAIGTD
jgi:hypothetical protein